VQVDNTGERGPFDNSGCCLDTTTGLILLIILGVIGWIDDGVGLLPDEIYDDCNRVEDGDDNDNLVDCCSATMELLDEL
jgi:hypothetical protein